MRRARCVWRLCCTLPRTAAPGDVGGGRLLRAEGGTEEIRATASFKVEVDDVLTVLTPGGGAFGAAGSDVGAGSAAIGAAARDVGASGSGST